MVLTGKLIAEAIVNIVLYFLGLCLAGNYQDGLFISSLGYGICLIAAYFASYFLDGHPHINTRMIVAVVLGCLTFNFVAAVLGPAIFAFSCILLEPFLASRGILPPR